MTQPRPGFLSADGSFSVDRGKPSRAWASVERAIDTWYYKEYDGSAPVLVLSSHLPDMTVWLIKQHCGQMGKPVTVRSEDVPADRGRLE
jgi:hypothetical protein